MLPFTILLLTGIILVACNFSFGVVRENSMLPTFQEGDIIVVKRRGIKMQKKKIYVLWHEDIYKIKRLDYIHEKGQVYKYHFLGDNGEESRDSRHFGFLSQEEVYGEVLCKVWRSNK